MLTRWAIEEAVRRNDLKVYSNESNGMDWDEFIEGDNGIIWQE